MSRNRSNHGYHHFRTTSDDEILANPISEPVQTPPSSDICVAISALHRLNPSSICHQSLLRFPSITAVVSLFRLFQNTPHIATSTKSGIAPIPKQILSFSNRPSCRMKRLVTDIMQTAFVTSTPARLRIHPNPLSRIPNRTTHSSQPPTCSLGGKLAALAAAFTLSLSDISFPRQTHASTIPQVHHQVILRNAYSSNHHSTTPVAVVGVGKPTIHDYITVPQSSPYSYTARATNASLHELDDEARREFSLAVRLVTAVLLGVLLGVERRATSFNLGVRSITLISLCTALVSLTMTGTESGFYMPMITSAPHMSIACLGALAGMTVYAAARMRQRRTRHRAGMCWTIGLGVAMGGGCGAGLSLLSVVCYLAAVAVLRADGGRVVERRRVRDSSVVHGEGLPASLEPRIKVGEGIDGSGFSA